MKDPRADRGREGFNKKSYDKGYIRAHYSCTNDNCSRRYECFRFLRTPTFKGNREKFIPQESGECEFFTPDRKDE